MNRVARAAVLLVTTAVAVISTSGPSYAVCEGDITPVNPESGVVGTLVSAPDTVTDGDPIE
ncbi:MAG: hypothetical protein ACRCYQ_08405, partial [Nocardioides sp.]